MNLYGMHDREGRHLVPSGGFCLDTVALSEKPQPVDYFSLKADIHWLVRLNWGYGSTGTLPLPHRQEEYIKAAMNYAAASKNAFGFIVGNEPNHEQERPDGVFLTPDYVASVFSKLRNALKVIDSEYKLIIPPLAPYHANPVNWLDYAEALYLLIEAGGGADGIAIHAYTRSSNPQDITSSAKMGPPLAGQYSGFWTYRDVLSVVPHSMRHLPAFITEFNELLNDGWHDANTGVVKEAYRDIHAWNKQPEAQKIHCLVLYRWPKYDKWAINGKNGVIQDFTEAVLQNYQVPASEDRETTHIPVVLPGREVSVPFNRQIDPSATARGVNIIELGAKPGEPVWKVRSIDWLNEAESQGRHHIYVDTRDSSGKRVTGVKLLVSWPTGNTLITSEEKAGEPYSANFPMSPGEFSIIVQGELSEMVRGIKMGADTPSGFNPGIHTSTVIVFERVIQGSTVTPDKPPVPLPITPKVPTLIHPVHDERFRAITQIFGVNEERYKRFKVDGVPLKGHNGIDYGTPVGTQIDAVADGRVVEVADDPTGYGLYVKLSHPWGETLYAHLRNQTVRVGDNVRMGQIVGYSGNTGNSTGPHLHFGMRVAPFNRRDGWGGYTDPLPYLKDATPRPVPPPVSSYDIVTAIKNAAMNSDLEWQLLASLAWAESSFDAQEENGGLFQIGEDAWSDYAARVGATDIDNPYDNALVGAAYFRFLLDHYDQKVYKALIAYNFGVGRVDRGELPPPLTIEYVNKVLHGRDLLKALGL